MMPITITCQRCGQEFKVKPSRAERTKYCSWECRFPIATKICEGCGKEFRIHPTRIGKAHYCSVECCTATKTEITGPNHPLWGERFPVRCEECGKVVYVKKSLVGKKRFCSYRCRSVNTIKNWGRTPTDLEIVFAQALDEADIDYQEQQTLENVAGVVDFVASDLAIFLDGDFWHGNPEKFPPEEWYELQENNHERDLRHTADLRAAGYTVLRFWGSEIRSDLAGCIETVKEQLALMDE